MNGFTSRRSRLLAGGVLALALVAGGCGSDHGSSSTAGADGSTQHAASRPDRSQYDEKPCPLLLPDPLLELLRGETEVMASLNVCRISLSGTDSHVSVWFERLGANDAKSYFDMVRGRATDPEDIAGIGDGAIYDPYGRLDGDDGPFALALSGDVVLKAYAKGIADSPEAKAMLIEELKHAVEAFPTLGY